jgi:hypothetical protein
MTTTPKPKSSIHLELGDVIRFHTSDPSNKTFHLVPLFIEYIDEYKSRVISTETQQYYTFEIENNHFVGPMEEEYVLDIKQVHLLSRSSERGYARQNGLLENTWIEIHIRITPSSPLYTIVGKIESLKEDRITVVIQSMPKEFGDNNLLYIDFGYRGIPENLHIEQILIMEEPSRTTTTVTHTPVSFVSMEDLVEITEEEISTIERQEDMDASEYLDAQFQTVDDAVFEPIIQIRGVSKTQMRYSLENQISNMLDEILSSLPPEQRSKKVIERIYIGIQRYIELRREFSVFEDGIITRAKVTSPSARPLKDYIQQTPLNWILYSALIERDLTVYNDANVNIKNLLDVHGKIVGNPQPQSIFYPRANPAFPSSLINNIPMSAETIVKYDNSSFGLTSNRGSESIDRRDDILKGYDSIERYNEILRHRVLSGEALRVASLILLPPVFQEYTRGRTSSTNILQRMRCEQMDIYPFMFSKVTPKRVSLSRSNKAWEQILSDKLEHYRAIEILPLSTGIDDLNKYLTEAIPVTNNLLKYLNKIMPISSQTSVHKYVQWLEPYGITIHDITYSHKQRQIQRSIGHTQYMIRETRRAYKEYRKRIGYKKKPMNKSESMGQILDRAYRTDSGNAYFSITIQDNIELFHDVGPKTSEDEKMEKSVEKAPTGMPNVVKEYQSEDDLIADNGVAGLLCDKQYDDTPYYIKQTIPPLDETMDVPTYKEYLREVLMFQYDCGNFVTDALLDAIVYEKRRVYKDELAVIRLENKKFAYYKYNADKLEWKFFKSSDVPQLVPSEPDPSNNKWLNKCVERLIEKRTNHFLKKIADNNPNIKYEDILARYQLLSVRNKSIKAYISEVSEEYVRRFNQLNHYNYLQRLKYDRVMEKMTQMERTFMKEKTASGTQVIQSPHLQLVYFIQSIDDLQSRSDCIRNFKAKFCREAIPPENKFWYYCRETSAKLLPTAIYELALAAKESTTVYRGTMDRICRNQGIINDDGNAYIDKHSGFFLRKIDDVENVEYDEHDRVIFAAAPLEPEAEEEGEEPIVSEKDKFVHEIVKRFQSVMGFDSSLLDVAFVVRFTSEIMEKYTEVYNSITSVAKYNEMLVNQKADVSKQPSFDTFMKINYITITSLVLLIAIQTTVPRISLKMEKTNVKNCVQMCIASLNAYPFVEDQTKIEGIQCMLCVAKVVGASFYINPKFFKEPVMKFYLQKIMGLKKTNNLLEIELRYRIAREYAKIMIPWGHLSAVNRVSLEGAIQDADIIPHSATRWPDFMPPLVPFRADIPDTTNNAHGSARLFTYYIVQRIQDMVRRETPLISTLSNIPFLQNACCNDNRQMLTPLEYFNKDTDFDNALKTCMKISVLQRRLAFISKPSMFYYIGSHPVLAEPTETSKQLKYRAIFHYAEFHTNRLPNYLMPLKDKLQKPEGYVSTDSIELNVSRASDTLVKNHAEVFEEVMKIIRLRGQIQIPPISVIVEEESYESRIKLFDKQKTYIMYNVVKPFFEKNHTTIQDAENARVAFTTSINKLTAGETIERVKFIQNCIYFMTRMVPAVVCHIDTLQNDLVRTDNELLPEQWGLFAHHKTQIQDALLAEWRPVLSKYNKNQIIMERMTELDMDEVTFIQKCSDIYTKYVVSPPQNFNTEELHKWVSFGLYQVIDMYIKLSCSPTDTFKWCSATDQSIEQVLDMSTQEKINKTVYELLHDMIHNLNETNKTVSLDYASIRNKMLAVRTKEKESITNKFKKLSNEDRRVMNVFKQYKLEEWNVTDINKYGSKTFRDGRETTGAIAQEGRDGANERAGEEAGDETLLGGAEMFEEHE